MTNDDQFDYNSEFPEEDTPTSYRTRPQSPPEMGRDRAGNSGSGSSSSAIPRRTIDTSGSTPARRNPPPLPEDDIPVTYSRPLIAPMEEEPPRRSSTAAPRATPRSEPVEPRRSTGTARQPLPQANVPPRVRSTTGAAGKPKNKRESGLYLPWWSLLILVIFVGAAAVGAWAVVGYLGGNNTPGGSTPMVVVITSTFTVGPPATPTAIPAVAGATAPPPLPTIAPTGTLPPGQFQVGATVKVVGVGEAGLNVRSSPGTDAVIKFRATENEEFKLLEQPQTASGIEWWFIQSASDETRSGWASRDFLEVLTP